MRESPRFSESPARFLNPIPPSSQISVQFTQTDKTYIGRHVIFLGLVESSLSAKVNEHSFLL